jgi:2'-hydroxyisoflavone reductase
MRILIIGGSSFVGRHITERAISNGHDVTLFNRGKTNPGATPNATHLTGDRDTDLSALETGEWDATIDVCAYVPRQVRTLLETLGERAGHYAFISTISVYGPEVEAGFDEDGAKLPAAYDDELVMELYGELKVGCEETARELAGDRLLIIRPGYVIGPYDPTHRFTYWVERIADGRSPMAGPDLDQPLQAIDGRDLAAFTVAQVEQRTVDAFHVTAPDPARTFGDVLATIAKGLGVELPEVRPMGALDELPLTAPDDWYSRMQAGLGRGVAAGLVWRPLEETVADLHAWVQQEQAAGTYRTSDRHGNQIGLTEEQEQELLSRA